MIWVQTNKVWFTLQFEYLIHFTDNIVTLLPIGGSVVKATECKTGETEVKTC